MRLSELMHTPQREELEDELPYPRSGLAEPAITVAEARAVDLSQETTVCRWHRGQHSHLNTDGKVYFCPIGRMYWRHARQPSGFLKALNYRR